MRYIYVDEAGTSAKEPVTVVVGIIVHADRQWRVAERHLADVFDRHVPGKFRSGFVFHAKEIWGSPRYRDGWSLEKRLEFLHVMMGVPKRLKLPFSVGMQRRGWLKDLSPNPPDAEMDHIMAFHFCVAKADQYLRDYCPADEVATVIAEDVPTLKSKLKKVIKAKFVLSVDDLRPTKAEQGSGIITQSGDIRVTRVIDSIHFVEKSDGPLLQIADACAFGFRRYFARQTFGDDFVRSMVGPSGLVAEDWAGGINGGLFFDHPRKMRFTARLVPVWKAPAS